MEGTWEVEGTWNVWEGLKEGGIEGKGSQRMLGVFGVWERGGATFLEGEETGVSWSTGSEREVKE